MRRLADRARAPPRARRARATVGTSAVTNLDVHDLARSARTYGCSGYFVVHPIAAQRELVDRIREHWTRRLERRSASPTARRRSRLRVSSPRSQTLERACGQGTEVWVTAARAVGAPTTWSSARAAIGGEGKPVLLVFGTGWGLAPEIVDHADVLLEPIHGAGEWNHLSVRAACAIALDRLVVPRA